MKQKIQELQVRLGNLDRAHKMKHDRLVAVAKQLVEVARAAWGLADNTEENATTGVHTVDPKDFANLSAALDKLDALPEISPTIIGTGPAKAGHWILNVDKLPDGYENQKA